MTNADLNVERGEASLKPLARAAVVGLLLLLPTAALGQPGEAGRVGAADSTAALEAAREAQARFERIRIARLPWTWSRSRGPCDERIGRFCFWHEDGGSEWEPPPEATGIVAAREALLDTLARIAEGLPGDRWVTGQRVRYLVEAGREGQARAVARASRVEPGWRAALEGYALHAAADYAAAEAAFDRALGAMPPEAARRWADPSLLLDGPARRIRDGLDPGSRVAFDRRMWWLADPLWSVPGNERRSEHFARRVLDAMQEDARSAYDVRWGHDLSELLIRYGWPVGWERVRAGPAALARDPGTRILAHDPPGGRRFVPGWEALSGPTVAPPGAWRLEAERPRSTYAPGYARRFVNIDAQVAAFRRGDGLRVVAGWTLAADSLDPVAEVEAALVVSASPDATPALARATTRGPHGVLTLDVPSEPAVVGVEGLARESRTAGRLRLGSTPPDRLSDLLLWSGGGSLPSTLEEAIPRARSGVEVGPGERVGIYLELYPPPGTPAADVAVKLRSGEVEGAWRAIGRVLGFGKERSTARLAWREPIGGETIHATSLELDPPDLPTGAYVLDVVVTWPDGEESRALRRLEIVRD
ncbi:MAG: hypothetical protein R3326_04265 [Gemmatimonadota bacterium]|nr:hypothetical protein [Gemmatimonadota bacterium]